MPPVDPPSAGPYPSAVSAIDSRKVLWANVLALMEARWERENLTRLAREADIGPGSATRLKQQQTSVGLELVDKIAALFGLETWQLLVPGFDPNNPPTLQPMSEAERALYQTVMRAARAFKDTES